MTGPESSSIALRAASLGLKTVLDVPLDTLDNDDRIIHNQPDGQHQSEHRKRVDGEAEQREENERADQRNGHGQQRDERGTPVLQKDVDDNNDRAQSAMKSVSTISFMPSVTALV